MGIQTEAKYQTADSSTSSARGKFRPLRVWPAVMLVVAMLIARFGTSLFDAEAMELVMVSAMGPLALGLLILIWWLTFSRAKASERIVGLIGILLVAAAAIALSDKSMRGPGTMLIGIPLGTAAFAVGAILCRNYLSFKRTLVAILVAACGFCVTAILRSDGMWGDFALGLHWRWERSAEEDMLAQRIAQPKGAAAENSPADLDAWLTEPEWPRFRGREGLSQQHGPVIATDWSTVAPELLWKIPVGPGWSSFSVAGNLLFTQEQRGTKEAVVCYAADSGSEIWAQQIESRFDEALGGPGPRATPTLAGGNLFALGGNGQLQRLNPKSGEIVWTKDLRIIAKRDPPIWGFSSSPLVIGSTVVVYAGGSDDKGVLAFDIADGELKWSAASGDHSYSSPHLADVGDHEYVLMLTNTGLNVLDPQSGQEELNYDWKINGYRVLQPQVIHGDSILLPTGMGDGSRLIRISMKDEKLSAEEVWTSRFLKPEFNDFVIHAGHAYGFDGAIFTCIDLSSGERKWKGGRYGKGQVLLLADSGILLVASEYGDVVLLKADPSKHQELATFHALEGKTWNHPVVIGDRLYIRNAQEAACYRLPLAAQAISKND